MFQIKTELRKGLFLLNNDWIIKTTIAATGIEIQWTRAAWLSELRRLLCPSATHMKSNVGWISHRRLTLTVSSPTIWGRVVVTVMIVVVVTEYQPPPQGVVWCYRGFELIVFHLRWWSQLVAMEISRLLILLLLVVYIILMFCFIYLMAVIWLYMILVVWTQLCSIYAYQLPSMFPWVDLTTKMGCVPKLWCHFRLFRRGNLTLILSAISKGVLLVAQHIVVW